MHLAGRGKNVRLSIAIQVNGKLAGYKKLHVVEFIDAIPKVPSGKILRRELKEREKALRAGKQV